MSKKILYFILFVSFLIGKSLYAQIDTLWTKVYANQDGHSLIASSIIQMNDGNYITAGYIKGENGSSYIMKLDSKGDSVWTKTYLPGSRVYSLQQTSDNYLIYTGEFDSGLFLLKTDLTGDTLWSKTYKLGNEDAGYDVQETDDGDYIIVGTIETQSAGDKICLIKTDIDGDTVWTKIFGESNNDIGNSIQQTSDGGYIIGYASAIISSDDYNLNAMKTDGNGIVQWKKTYFVSPDRDGPIVKELTDGSFIIQGTIDKDTSDYYDKDICLVKTDANGDIIWTKVYGGTEREAAFSFEITPDDGLIIAGYTRSFGAGRDDVYLVRTDVNGDTLWTKTFGWQEDEECPICITKTLDGGYIIIASTESFSDHDAILIIKTEPDPLNDVDSKNQSHFPNDYCLFQNYPNPFNPSTTIRYTIPTTSQVTVEIYNILGQRVMILENTKKQPGYYTVEWNALNFASGIYFVKIQCQDPGERKIFKDFKKMVLLK